MREGVKVALLFGITEAGASFTINFFAIFYSAKCVKNTGHQFAVHLSQSSERKNGEMKKHSFCGAITTTFMVSFFRFMSMCVTLFTKAARA